MTDASLSFGGGGALCGARNDVDEHEAAVFIA